MDDRAIHRSHANDGSAREQQVRRGQASHAVFVTSSAEGGSEPHQGAAEALSSDLASVASRQQITDLFVAAYPPTTPSRYNYRLRRRTFR
mgnify:CR=1 FL=1